MKFDQKKLALSFGGTTAVLWIVCSALVALIPGPTGKLMGHMLHGNLEGFSWTLTWAGFFIGLVSWVLWAAAAGWLVGWSYNRLGESSES
jgi:hypothetical protein